MNKIDRQEIKKELEEVKDLFIRLPEMKRERAKGYMEGLATTEKAS